MVMGGTPWGDAERLQRNNPMFYAKTSAMKPADATTAAGEP